MRFARMYTEPSCTPTRVAFMTGRQPYRNGMANTAVDISGFGLADKEVTLAEVLSDSGYNTVHIGKWKRRIMSWPISLIIKNFSAPQAWRLSKN